MYRPRNTWVEHGTEYTVCSVCQRLIESGHRDSNGACVFCEDVARVRNEAELAQMKKDAAKAAESQS